MKPEDLSKLETYKLISADIIDPFTEEVLLHIYPIACKKSIEENFTHIDDLNLGDKVDKGYYQKVVDDIRENMSSSVLYDVELDISKGE